MVTTERLWSRFERTVEQANTFDLHGWRRSAHNLAASVPSEKFGTHSMMAVHGLQSC